MGYGVRMSLAGLEGLVLVVGRKEAGRCAGCDWAADATTG